jgi:hypothetical protein
VVESAYAVSTYSLKAKMGERAVDSGGLETLVLVKGDDGRWKIRHSHTPAVLVVRRISRVIEPSLSGDCRAFSMAASPTWFSPSEAPRWPPRFSSGSRKGCLTAPPRQVTYEQLDEIIFVDLTFSFIGSMSLPDILSMVSLSVLFIVIILSISALDIVPVTCTL